MTTEATPAVPYVEHIGMTRQYWRDIILGINDGLVSMLLLVAGVGLFEVWCAFRRPTLPNSPRGVS